MAPHEPTEPSEPAEQPPPRRALRLLVVDDDRDAVVTLSALLQEDGHEVIAAYSGAAVLALVRSREPDAVLLDIGMPGATGFEVAREMGRTVGFNHYLTKPYTGAELRAVLASLAPPAR